MAVVTLESVDKFVETGDVEYFKPDQRLRPARNRKHPRSTLDKAQPVPAALIEGLPDEVDRLADGVRWVSKSELPGNLSWPSIAFRHSDTRAIVFVDLIVFREAPGYFGCDLALWTHELFHVKQYQVGAAEFTKRYMANEMGFRPIGQSNNTLEVEADLFACQFYPNCEAVYLAGRVCPSR